MDYLEKIRKSVCRYLDYQSRERDALNSTLTHLAENLDETIIFGGMIREFALGNTREFKSDIDLVTCSTRNEIFSVIEKFSPKINKFGGFRFIVGTQIFDVWSFNDTWAFREGLVQGNSFDDLFKTTFFNIDAAGFDLKTRQPLLSDIYIEALKTRTLDLNLVDNPAPAAMAKRAVKLALENNLAVSNSLLQYILEYSEPISHSEYEDFLRAVNDFSSRSSSDKFWFWDQKCLFPEIEEISGGNLTVKVTERNLYHKDCLVKDWSYKHWVSEEKEQFKCLPFHWCPSST